MSEILDGLISNNRAWAREMKRVDPQFFIRLSEQQRPRYLWIGCSDSRVPANQIVGLQPGEVFVHRNVGNIVSQTDFNCLAVLQYAVEVLGVNDIIVCGHYGCGAVSASMQGVQLGLIDNWLHGMRLLYRLVRDKLDRADPSRRNGLMCEMNVIDQVKNVCATTVVQNAWREGRPVTVHGCIYGIQNGLLKDLGVHIDSEDAAASINVTSVIEKL